MPDARLGPDWIAVLRKSLASDEMAALAARYGRPTVTDADEDEDNPPTGADVYTSWEAAGVSIKSEFDRVTSVQLYATAHSGFRPFAGPLPFGLRPGMSRGAVRGLLGPATDRDEIYDWPAHGIRLYADFAYAADNTLCTVHLMPLEDWVASDSV